LNNNNIHSSTKKYLGLFCNDEQFINSFSAKDIEFINYHIANTEERTASIRDDWGNWEFPYTDYDYTKPYVDDLILQHIANNQFKQRQIWPDGKKFAISISHDVDLVTQSSYKAAKRQITKIFVKNETIFKKLKDSKFLLSYVNNLRRLANTNDSIWCYEKWLEAIDKQGFKSTFYYFARPALKDMHKVDCDFLFSDKVVFMGNKMTVAEMMQKMHEQEYEIGVHGSYYTALNSNLLKEQINQVENVIGVPVTANRQHWLHYNINVTPQIHKDAGVHTDSTMGFNRTIGFRNGCSMPYYLLDKNYAETNVLEIPMHIMDGALFEKNSLLLNKEYALKKSLALLDKVEKVGGCCTINFHPNYVSNPDWWWVFNEFIKEAKLRNAYGATASQIKNVVEKALNF
jgi:hypothetical protein